MKICRLKLWSKTVDLYRDWTLGGLYYDRNMCGGIRCCSIYWFYILGYRNTLYIYVLYFIVFFLINDVQLTLSNHIFCLSYIFIQKSVTIHVYYIFVKFQLSRTLYIWLRNAFRSAFYEHGVSQSKGKRCRAVRPRNFK